jgi:hypothetical protein
MIKETDVPPEYLCRVILHPRHKSNVHNMDAASIDQITLQLAGYQQSRHITVPGLSLAHGQVPAHAEYGVNSGKIASQVEVVVGVAPHSLSSSTPATLPFGTYSWFFLMQV